MERSAVLHFTFVNPSRVPDPEQRKGWSTTNTASKHVQGSPQIPRERPRGANPNTRAAGACARAASTAAGASARDDESPPLPHLRHLPQPILAGIRALVTQRRPGQRQKRRFQRFRLRLLLQLR